MISLLLLIFLSVWTHIDGFFTKKDQAVVVKVPITDCLGKSAQKIDPSISVEDFYHNIPYSPEYGSYSCPRIHQCLYNEMGTLIKETEDEVLVEFPHFYFLVNNKPHSRFWLKKDSICRITSNHKYIPQPYTADNKYDKSIVTLMHPWHDQETNIWYSAGTRFVRSYDDTAYELGISLVDFGSMSVRKASITRHLAVINEPRTIHTSKQLFIDILRQWIDDYKVVPYVWGGCSYIERKPFDDYSLIQASRQEKDIAYWDRPGNSPHSGCDCSGLVLRVAQIAGINYFCKNTTTIGKTLQDVSSFDELEEGDLILIPGHIMVVADLSEHTLIDAASYNSGYGCLREVPLSYTFEGIETYEELFEASQSAGELTLLTHEGNPLKTVSYVRLLRLA